MPRTELFRGGGYVVVEETSAIQRPGAQPSGSLLLISSPDGDWCRPAQDYALIRALLARLREVEARREHVTDAVRVVELGMSRGEARLRERIREAAERAEKARELAYKADSEALERGEHDLHLACFVRANEHNSVASVLRGLLEEEG